jgi:hypothetical protein
MLQIDQTAILQRRVFRKKPNFSEERIACIFRVNEKAKQQMRMSQAEAIRS